MTNLKEDAKKGLGWDWGMDEGDFPAMTFDNFDGSIADMKYENGQYSDQIYLVLQPPEYEFEARGLDFVDFEETDEGLPKQWFGLGGESGNYEFSEDGYEILSGPTPRSNTRGVTLILGIRNHGKVKMEGTSLKQLLGTNLHWKAIMAKGQVKGDDGQMQSFSKPILTPVGAALGYAAISEKGKKSSGSSGRSRRNGRGESGNDQSSDAVIVSTDDLANLFRSVLGDADGGSMKLRAFSKAAKAKSDDFSEDVIRVGVEVGTVKRLVSAGVIVEDDGVISLAPVEGETASE